LAKPSRVDIAELLRTAVSRGGALALSQQMRSVLEMAAAAGELPDGVPLPSVRRLAKQLGLAPNTVVRAYKQLEAEGIVTVSPRRAYFVVGAPKFTTPASTQVQGLIDEALRAAERAGLDTVQFLQLVSKVIKARRDRVERVAVVGDRDAALETRVNVIRRALADMPVDIVPLSFEDLGTPEGALLASAVDYYVVPMLDTERAAAMLGPHAYRILPMYLILTDEVRSFIAALDAKTRFGIIVSRESYRARLATAVRRIHSPTARISTASVEKRSAVERVVNDADVILISSPARARMPASIRVTKPMMEMTFLPDDETIRRLRAIVAADVPAHARARSV
jgi:GntR family transcriptional regulator